MLSIYSPTFFAAQREFLSALRAAKSGLDQPGDQQVVVETARRRLELWDIPQDEIKALETTGKPSKSLTLRSPISGTVLEKTGVCGSVRHGPERSVCRRRPLDGVDAGQGL